MQPVDERGREVARLLEGRYEVLGLLGRGGFAAVYQVRNLRLQRLEAIKVVAGSHEESSDFLRRFEHESRVAASLEHPNILKVYDFGHVGGILWYSMPFVDGPTLAVEIGRRGVFEETAAVRLFVPLLDALEYSHGRGVIHRDIKPDNILLDRRDRPYLMDFGIAKTDDSLVKTQTGFVLGSPAYISPEQLKGERLDGRTDVYSLGVSLFQVVSGSVPFRSDRMADLANRLVAEAPRLASRKTGVSPELDRIVARALARSRDERYAGAREMRRDLEAFLDAFRTQPAAAKPADDPAFGENTASLSVRVPSSARVPAIEPPPPPPPPPPEPPRPARPVSTPAASPPVTVSASSKEARAIAPPKPAGGRRTALVAALAAAAVAVAVGVGVVLMSRTATVAPPSPTAVPAAPRPASSARQEETPPPLPTQVPTAAPPTMAPPPTVAAVSPTRPPRQAAAPFPRAPERSAERAPERTAPAAAAAAAAPPLRRARTQPDVEELATLALSPEQERACGGKVVGVAVVVGEDGSLVSRRVISPASSTCDPLALEVLARSRFKPALDETGRPMEGRFAVAVRF
jgi:serine/threonine-protein kinase